MSGPKLSERRAIWKPGGAGRSDPESRPEPASGASVAGRAAADIRNFRNSDFPKADTQKFAMDGRKVQRLCENYLRKMKVVGALLIVA